MNWIKAQWAILKKYGFTFSVCLQTGVAIYFFIRAFMSDDYCKGVCFGCFGVMFIMMPLLDFVVARMRNEVDKCKEVLSDTKDKLCLSEHEVDRLKFELGTLQAAFKEGEKRRREATKKEKEAAQKTDETTPVAEQKTKRPSFKRKPKLKTDTPDENKN